jgi:septal ring factor EnvC (AmiA/AmiB activator)
MSDAQFDKLIGWLEGKFSSLEARLEHLEASMQSLRVEMNERFQSVNDRLDALEQRTVAIAEGFQETRAELSKVVQRLDRVDTSIYELHQKLNGVGDDMRQRFRGVTERLAAVEQRLVA